MQDVILLARLSLLCRTALVVSHYSIDGLAFQQPAISYTQNLLGMVAYLHKCQKVSRMLLIK